MDVSFPKDVLDDPGLVLAYREVFPYARDVRFEREGRLRALLRDAVHARAEPLRDRGVVGAKRRGLSGRGGLLGYHPQSTPLRRAHANRSSGSTRIHPRVGCRAGAPGLRPGHRPRTNPQADGPNLNPLKNSNNFMKKKQLFRTWHWLFDHHYA